MAELSVADVGAWVVGLAGFAAALSGLWRWSKLGELLRGTRLFLADWFGEPERPGREALPSFPERMAKVEERTAALNHDLRGELSSRLILLAHNVDRVHEQGATAADKLAVVEHRVSEHRRRNDEQIALLREAIARNEAALDAVRARSRHRREGDPPDPIPLSTED